MKVISQRDGVEGLMSIRHRLLDDMFLTEMIYMILVLCHLCRRVFAIQLSPYTNTHTTRKCTYEI
jgi:hypothetical protein